MRDFHDRLAFGEVERKTRVLLGELSNELGEEFEFLAPHRGVDAVRCRIGRLVAVVHGDESCPSVALRRVEREGVRSVPADPVLEVVHDATQKRQPIAMVARVVAEPHRPDEAASATVGPVVELDRERCGLLSAVNARAVLLDNLPGRVVEIVRLPIEPLGDSLQVDVDAFPVRVRCVVVWHVLSPDPQLAFDTPLVYLVPRASPGQEKTPGGIATARRWFGL
ncbi:MAG: hypothetical protein AMXMBFR77_01780 [Phycisphaerales bacterium]|nr:hypothetical protein [Leptolyngbya sp.]MCQ3939616.1 hypothetical protein [cyanobacterium CYA1]MCZ7632140.1 hypothetical protein [Phycisphaerales bacterium]MDL1903872.1 hypothetical protein [Synechococcales cyanobacterium CNB]GIK18587.1 MAG: hypothetical protein BroJett004_07510 [Planctomycetota bacterium]